MIRIVTSAMLSVLFKQSLVLADPATGLALQPAAVEGVLAASDHQRLADDLAGRPDAVDAFGVE